MLWLKRLGQHLNLLELVPNTVLVSDNVRNYVIYWVEILLSYNQIFFVYNYHGKSNTVEGNLVWFGKLKYFES